LGSSPDEPPDTRGRNVGPQRPANAVARLILATTR
jgi:hypothetical protein